MKILIDDGEFVISPLTKGQHMIKKQADTKPYIPLGYREGMHYFYLKKDGEIFKTNTFTVIHLLNLDDRANWQKLFPDRDSKKPSTHRFNSADAADFLIRLSKGVGLFDPNKVRGNGAWQDESRVVINCGNFLLVDGERSELADFKSKFVYVKSLKEMPTISVPLAQWETKLITETAKVFKWSRECDAHFLLGWLMLAPISGALPIRPHIWLTGKKGMGKSTVFERFVTKLLGDLALAGVGPSTEAGIRQAAQHSAQPFIHDEFEVVDSRSGERIGKIVEFLRSCWSDTAARTFKGTAGGTHLSYNARLIAFVTGINVQLQTEADRSRFTILELQSHSEDPVQRLKDKKKINEHLNQISNELSGALFARSVSMIPSIIESYELLSDLIAGELTSREGQQLGMLLAGYWAYEHDDPITYPEAKKLFSEISASLESSKDSDNTISDEEECLTVLLTHQIRFTPAGEREPVEDIIGNMIYCLRSQDVLLNYGIKVNHAKKAYAVAYHHAELSKIYRGTRWEKSGSWINSLARLPNAKRQSSSSFGSRDIQQRSILIPQNGKQVQDD